MARTAAPVRAHDLIDVQHGAVELVVDLDLPAYTLRPQGNEPDRHSSRTPGACQ